MNTQVFDAKNHMTSKLYIAQKIISLALIAWGLYGVYKSIEPVMRLSANFDAPGLVRLYHLLLIVSIISFTGGLLLLFDKTTGWTLSIASLAINAVLYFIPSNKYYDHVFASPELGMLILLAVMATFCITGLIILLQKPFRETFTPTTKTWWIIQTIILACIFDRVYFYLRSF